MSSIYSTYLHIYVYAFIHICELFVPKNSVFILYLAMRIAIITEAN